MTDPTPRLYSGKTPTGTEYLLTVHPAHGTAEERHEVAFRAAEWETFDPPVRLFPVPVEKLAGEVAS